MRTPHITGTPARDHAEAGRVYESRRRRLLLSLVATLFLMLLAAPSAFAQTTGSATLRGVIKDANGDVIPGATVTLTSQKTAASRSTITTEDGLYVFAQVDPDVYTLQVEASSFRTYIQTELRVSPADTRGQDVTLEVGGASRLGL